MIQYTLLLNNDFFSKFKHFIGDFTTSWGNYIGQILKTTIRND